MKMTIIATLRIAAAGALPPLAALACAAPTPTVVPIGTPPCEGDEPDCLPHPFDITPIQGLYQGVN